MVKMDVWMILSFFFVSFNSMSVISKRCKDETESECDGFQLTAGKCSAFP